MFLNISSLEILMHYLLKAIAQDNKNWFRNSLITLVKTRILEIKTTYFIENTEKQTTINQIKYQIQEIVPAAICSFDDASEDQSVIRAELNKNLQEVIENQPDYRIKTDNETALDLLRTKMDDLMSVIFSQLETVYPSKAVAQLVSRYYLVIKSTALRLQINSVKLEKAQLQQQADIMTLNKTYKEALKELGRYRLYIQIGHTINTLDNTASDFNKTITELKTQLTQNILPTKALITCTGNEVMPINAIPVNPPLCVKVDIKEASELNEQFHELLLEKNQNVLNVVEKIAVWEPTVRSGWFSFFSAIPKIKKVITTSPDATHLTQPIIDLQAWQVTQLKGHYPPKLLEAVTYYFVLSIQLVVDLQNKVHSQAHAGECIDITPLMLPLALLKDFNDKLLQQLVGALNSQTKREAAPLLELPRSPHAANIEQMLSALEQTHPESNQFLLTA